MVKDSKFFENGIIVDNSPILLKEIKNLNQGFITSIEKRGLHSFKVSYEFKRKIATQTKKSNWISGEKSRNFVQLIRSHYDAIMIGTRLLFGIILVSIYVVNFLDLPQPAKIIIDKDLKLSKKMNLIESKDTEKLFFVHDLNLKKKKLNP